MILVDRISETEVHYSSRISWRMAIVWQANSTETDT